MYQDSFRSVVCRSLSRSHPSKSKDSSYPEAVQCAVPCIVTLQPSVSRSCQGREPSVSQSCREERSMSFHRDYHMAPSLSKHFAEDLLRGAMDLQESLAMLERFQAASQSMRLITNKKGRPETGQKSPEIDNIVREVLLRPLNTKQVLSRTVKDGLHGQLSSSTDELKNEVKDSLYMKNLLSVLSNDRHTYLSQSSRYPANDYLMSKTSQEKKVVPRSIPPRAPVQPDKSKAPSLVAKLMGLDELPSQNDNSIMKDEKIKTVSSPRALFDIEMPKSKRLLPQLFGEASCFDMEVPRSETLPPEHCNVRINYTGSQKGINPSNNTTVVNENESRKPIQRERNVEQARPRFPKEIKIVTPTTSRKQQMKENTEINRRTREKQKPHLTGRNREERNDVKEKAGPVSRNVKVVKKHDKKLVASSSMRTCDSTKPILHKATNNSREKIISRRNVKSSTTNELMVHEIEREFFHALDQMDGASTEHSATPSEEGCPSADWDVESSMDEIQKDFGESNQPFLSASHNLRSIADGAAINPSSTDMIPASEAEIKDDIILLLLSDKLLLSRAAELIGNDAHKHLSDQHNGIYMIETENQKLYLDIATEQLERKHGHQSNLCYTAFQVKKCVTPAYFSLEALLRDISDGIRKLKSYSDKDRGGTKDSLDMKLERDLRCTDTLINGMWDIGWQNLNCMEETECIIRDAGEDILSLLIEEAALDMWIH